MQIGSVMFITSVVKILILEYSFSLPPWIKRTSLSEKEKWNDKALTRFTNKKKQMVILELWLKLFAEHSLTEDIWKIFPSSYIQNFPCKKMRLWLELSKPTTKLHKLGSFTSDTQQVKSENCLRLAQFWLGAKPKRSATKFMTIV